MSELLRCALRGVAAGAALLLAAGAAQAQVATDEPAPGAAPDPPAEAASGPGPGPLAEEELRDGVVLRVLDLERLGSRAVKATLEVENGSGEKVSLMEIGVLRKASGGLNTVYDVGHVALVDFENGKKYKVISDAQGHCVCSRGGGLSFRQIEAGQSRKLWVQLTPPPLEVTSVSLEVPGAMMFDELPIAP